MWKCLGRRQALIGLLKALDNEKGILQKGEGGESRSAEGGEGQRWQAAWCGWA